MFMTTNIAEEDANTVSEQVQFTPRYPVYDVDQMAMNAMTQSPPPNPPQKKKKRKKKMEQQPQMQEMEKSGPPRESTVEI